MLFFHGFHINCPSQNSTTAWGHDPQPTGCASTRESRNLSRMLRRPSRRWSWCLDRTFNGAGICLSRYDVYYIYIDIHVFRRYAKDIQKKIYIIKQENQDTQILLTWEVCLTTCTETCFIGDLGPKMPQVKSKPSWWSSPCGEVHSEFL